MPRILFELPDDDPPGWRVRAVPNRYPAFHVGAEPQSDNDERPGGGFGTTTRDAVGSQEVIIETPRHDLDPATMSVGELSDVLRVLHHRYVVHQKADATAHTVLFRNRGREAGNSLVHPHAQLYSLRRPAPLIDQREQRYEQFYRAHGACLLCSLDEIEPDAARLRVAENRAFVARIPWAPVTSLEVWIHPRRHRPSFGLTTSNEDRQALADILSLVLSRYRERAGDPAYNLVWHGSRLAESDAPHLHWYIQVLPKIARRAGFELGTDVDICPSAPTDDAALLR